MGRVKQQKRIAVIAVHGVADQQPGDSVQQAADLLRGHCKGYTWQAQSGVRIPVEAVSTEFEASAKRGLGALELDVPSTARYMSQTLREAIQGEPATALSEEPPLELCDMREQLLGYEPRGPDVTYETPRIDLRRSDCQCHVFEMFWADLSRLQTRIIGTLVAFFQFLFFLCQLGSRAIHYARANYAKGKSLWRLFNGAHGIAHGILVLGIPILNLALLGFAIAVVASGYYQEWNPTEKIEALILGGMLAVAGALFFIFGPRSSVGAWPWKYFVLLVVVPLVAILLPRLLALNLERWIPLITWLIMIVAIVWLMTIYERRRRGAVLCSVLILLLITAAFLYQLDQLGWPSEWSQLFDAGVKTLVMWIRYGHWPLWIGFAIFTLVCWLLSEAAVRFSGLDREDKQHARRAAVTAKVSLAIPGVLVFIVGLGLWQLIVRGLDILPGDLIQTAQKDKAVEVLMGSVPVGTGVGLILFLVAALFAVWLILPAVVAESRPPKDAADWLGRMLSAGFRNLKWSGWVCQLLITIGLLASVVLWAEGFIGWRDLDAVVVVVLGGTLFLLFMFRGAGKAIRSALDIALDVANWLRHDPPDRTPCARICARFASLLRHVCNWRDPGSGAPYDAIVILAHSQGAVITADLFRYLKYVVEPDLAPIFRPEKESERLPVYLFTMGCPLRQLYSLRFPDQYAWARDTADWDSATKPNPDNLSVELWANFYRSGDYVGRVLWHPDADQANTSAWDDQEREKDKRSERCIGSGAHTHYWDETAPEIAQKLDYLIGQACNR